MIEPASVCLYIPPELARFKLELFNRIGRHVIGLGGRTTGDAKALEALSADVVPIVGCSPQLREMIARWQRTRRNFIYWDRGYARRVFATWLPRGDNGGYYRWHLNSYQLREIGQFPQDRWDSMATQVEPWHKDGKHVVVARPSTTYCKFHGVEDWLDRTIYQLSLVTKRQLIVRDKESKRSLQSDLDGAHCLVTHGSIAAVEAVICGYPVFVDPSSAAALVGRVDLSMIEEPVYPDRQPWLNALAYSQFNEAELCDGTLWKLMS